MFPNNHQPQPYDQCMWDLNRLRMWRAVVSAGSVTAAARNLQYSPASVSQQVIALQQTVGFPLYRRVGRGIEVTEAGRRFAEETDALFAESTRLTRVVNTIRSGPRERISIGCPSSVAKEWIPAVLREAVQHHPDLQFDVLTNEPLLGADPRRPDIEVTSEPGHADAKPVAGYRSEHLVDDAYMLVIPRGHPDSARSAVPVAELSSLPLLDLDVQESATGDVIDEAMRAAGIDPPYVARADDHYGVLAMVAAGIGVAPLPRLAAQDLPESLTLVPLTDPVPFRRMVLRVRKSLAHLPHISTLRNAFVRASGATAEETRTSKE